ncbi:MAG: hypothetical protein JWQ02_2414 [Capsulimonas sp.]|jgi:hypothetical protein|nr:hypothetical protein [Capsulimonas sp.]
MPQFVFPDWTKLFPQLFNGTLLQSALPATVYAGILSSSVTPTAADTLSTYNGGEITGGGYARLAITRNSTNFPDSAGTAPAWQLVTPTQSFAAFTGNPTVNNGRHIFLTDQASGYSGKLYTVSPMNPAAVSSTLQASAASAQAVVKLTNTIAASLNTTDWLAIGTVGTSANQEFRQITTIGAIDSGGAGLTNVTLTANLTSAHASGEPVYRDGVTRVYSAGITQQFALTELFTQG